MLRPSLSTLQESTQKSPTQHLQTEAQSRARFAFRPRCLDSRQFFAAAFYTQSEWDSGPEAIADRAHRFVVAQVNEPATRPVAPA